MLPLMIMRRRRTLILEGKDYPCIEILYKYRNKLSVRTGICIACYVTLPKVYHYVNVSYGKCADIVNKKTPGLIYSYLLIPVNSVSEAKPIMELVENLKILTIH